jgi:UDP-N-acetylmuramoyl-L-alanyl-D-glutamate--2,6-diaminopimelate ligase
MEVSSHSLVQEKIGPIQYAAAAFTSFSRDHLDFHRDMNDYFAAKWRLFTEFLLPGAAGFIHTSVDPSLLPATLPARLAFYGKLPAPYGIDVIKRDLAGSRVALRDGKAVHEGDLPFFADHAAANFLAAWLLVKQSQNVAVPPAAWRKLRPVPGRLEPVAAPAGKPFVFVDYAHTPDALEKTLAVLQPLTKGRLWVVFGCGGDRDKGKRPLMAQIAEKLAQRVVVTSDNPRTEDPDAILREIMVGFKEPRPVTALVDREEAIAFAIREAAATDAIVIAGKGHENYQIVGTTKRPFDDKDVAVKYLGQK